MKKTILFITVLILFNTHLFSQEATDTTQLPATQTTTASEQDNTQTVSKEDQYFKVEGLENWHYDFDVSDYPEGKYNIIIKGTDLAGNEYFEGPFNIIIDPESDKPVINISNPEPGMNVSGNLNIVGTCIDDDSVDRVEIKIDDGIFMDAEGTEFWSYYLSTDEMEDGEYTLTARGIDSGGTEGNEYSVNFTIDKSAPVNTITSFENGALLNGKVTLEGVISDRNGVEKLEMSIDGGLTFDSIPVKSKKNEPDAAFSVKIDTKKLDDGPQIYWFRSTDKMGSAGVSAFLFFVDNKEPALEILYPTEDFQVNGKFRVVGLVRDEVGIESLYYKTAKNEPIEIPLSIGDPYWFQDFDFSNVDKTDIIFTLTDKTGNSTEHKIQLKLDTEGDLPTIELISPLPDSTESTDYLSGYVTDDDGVKEIFYSIDGETPVSIPSAYSFNIPLKDLASGQHKLKIYAVDINGVEGKEISSNFTTILDGPEIYLDSATAIGGEISEKLSPGKEVNTQSYKTINGTVRFYNLSGKASISINGSEYKGLSLKKTDSPDIMSFSISLKGIIPGFTDFTIDAEDKNGISSSRTFQLKIGGLEPIAEDKQFYLSDNRFSQSKNEPIAMNEGDEVSFYLNGGNITEAVLTEGFGFLSLSDSANVVILKAVSPGYAENIQIKISTSSGSSKEFGPFSIGVDSEPPEIKFSNNVDGFLVNENLEISGQVSDDTGVKNLFYSINGGTENPISIEGNEFITEINLMDQADGGQVIIFTVTDLMDNSIKSNIYVMKDSTQPTFIQLTPVPDIDANGKITLTGRTEDSSQIRSIEFSEDGINFIPIEGLEFPTLPIDLTLFESEKTIYTLRITDMSGNTTIVTPQIKVEKESDKPEIRIQIPREGEIIQSDFLISGMAFDDDEISTLMYRIDDNEFQQIKGANNFEVPISIRDISDNKHSFEIKAIDPGGVESDLSLLTFSVSKSEPESFLSNPSIDTTVKDLIILSGESSDENGIENVLISYDNGNTFNKADIQIVHVEEEVDEVILEEDTGTDKPEESVEIALKDPIQTSVKWDYRLNTNMLEDGTHSLLIKAIDKNGVEGLYTSLINIDNTAPVIELSNMFDGLQVVDTLELKGRLTDNIQLESVILEIEQLNMEVTAEGVKPQLTRELPTEEIILENIDLSEFPAGWINLKITAFDQSGNRSVISRNLERIDYLNYNKAVFFSPTVGEKISGSVMIQGKIESLSVPSRAAVTIDGFPGKQLKIKETGYFHGLLDSENLNEGSHLLTVEVELEDGTIVRTEEREIFYSKLGPWITIDNLSAGDFINNRPWLTGSTGYNYDIPLMDEKAIKTFHKTMELERVEVSLDNGRSFTNAKGESSWQFRLETMDIPDGEIGIIVRARFKDGASAVSKTRLVVDDSPPRIEMTAPSEGMKFNDNITLRGIGSDAFGLEDISVSLREGDKSRYQVPSFIQGLYLDVHALGSTYAELGFGLTFFDDNVKLQLQLGMAPSGRFNGFVVGTKLLANIAVLPYEYFFGYDWSFLSSSFAVGATFNYFTMSEEEISFTDQGLVLGALIGQIELIKVTLPDRKLFTSFSLYTEGQLWFISSDVSGGVESRIAFGLRTNIF